MIARPNTGAAHAAAPLAELQAEADAELAAAYYVVPTIDDADALTAAGFTAGVAGAPGTLDHVDIVFAASQHPVAVLVGTVDSGLGAEILERSPHATVRALPRVRSPCMALGYVPTCTTWSAAERDAKHRTWLSIATEAMIERAPVDELPDASDGYRPFPVAALPRICRDIVEAGARAQGIDVAYWAAPLLGVLSGAIGSTRRVAVKQSWREPAILWTCVIAPSGAGKSPALRELLAPMRAHDQRLHDRTVALQQAAVAAATAQGAGGRVERVPQLCAIVADATIEALCTRLADNERGLLLAVDELAAWIRGWDRYHSGGGDEQQWLSLHNGDPIRVDRKSGQQSISVPSPAVAVTGTVQPGVARKYFGAVDRRESGAAARLLLCMPPVSIARWTDNDIGEGDADAYGRVVRSLLDLEMPRTDDGRGAPGLLKMTSEARRLFVDYHDANGAESYAANVSGRHDLAAVLSKLRGAAVRLALVVALAEAAEHGTAALLTTVDVKAMRAGIELARWFEIEARRIYARWDREGAAEASARSAVSTVRLAERIAQILAGGAASKSDLHDATGRNLTAKELDDALELLRASGRAACGKQAGRGRPREVWYLLPTPADALTLRREP